MKRPLATIAIALALSTVETAAQDFVNLTASQVRVDSVLPYYGTTLPLTGDWADSTYRVAIEYPEFIDMSDDDIARLRAITTDTMPSLPVVEQWIAIDRKRASLDVGFVPIVFREGKYQKLVSFRLALDASAKHSSKQRIATRATADDTPASRYAANSVLRSGTWAKIRVARNGVHELTDELLRQAGFAASDEVKVYGYGGALQPETLSDDYLRSTDDLKQVAQCVIGDRRLFYANGPVYWDSSNQRVRNPYSDYGYYFLTTEGEAVETVDSAEFVGSFYPSGDDYNTLYEVDDYAWFQGGRNLYDAQVFAIGTPRTYQLNAAGQPGSGELRVVLTADASSEATITVNGLSTGSNLTTNAPSTYDAATIATRSYELDSIAATNTVSITQTSGGTMRLDYLALHTYQPKAAPRLSADAFPVPEYVHHITNQDLHSHDAVDMVIIIPTTQALLAQAERIKSHHEQADGLSVRIVPADELYNEFSSGTPDATAYRRYMKMLYDRAGSADEAPKYLLLLGDGAWDNRMLTADWRGYSPDDYLLCFESENSMSDTQSFVCDDFFCLLDDDEAIQSGTASNSYRGRPDVAVGRLPARTAAEAEVMVTKTINYANNANAGAWQNTIVVMGDDGNDNIHMRTADSVAKTVLAYHPHYSVRKIMWDAYNRVSSASGNSYPDATTLIRQYMRDGALMMNYSGHGVNYCMSHERVVQLADFSDIASNNLTLWMTASCDIMPFDGQMSNIGETAMLNPNGGAVAFYGTTRTVYSNYNTHMNIAFTREVLSQDDGGVSIGEAVRRAKVSLVDNGLDRTTNKLHYLLLGDPALRLATPKLQAVVDSINGQPVSADNPQQLSAGSVAVVKGHIVENGALATGFNGTVTATVSDAEQEVVCKLNNTTADGASTAFHFYDRSSIVFNGSDNVNEGQFTFTFAVPKDISYSDDNAIINIYAVSDDHSATAAGANEGLVLNGSGALGIDSVGPSIYCYLNSTSFTNGDWVNTTPYFVAELTDEDGINASGSGIGHDLQLVIDGDAAQTYTLNNYFSFDFGSYTSGTVGFSLPALSEGQHTLRFRAWDILNNSSTAELTFNVSRGAQPAIVSIDCTRNPATTSTSFRIVHDRKGSEMDVRLDIFDMAGRHLWTYAENGVATDNSYTIDWDLTIDGGRRLGTGVYLYRVGVSTDGSDYTTEANKLIVISNK